MAAAMGQSQLAACSSQLEARSLASEASWRLLDGRVVLAGLLVSIGVTVLTPPDRWPRLVGEAALLAVACAALSVSGIGERRGVRWLMGRVLLMVPFLLLAGVSAPFMAGGPGQLSTPASIAFVFGRACVACGALAVAAQAAGTAELLRAVARWRVPPIFVTLATLMLRYLGVLESEAARMMRARDLRGTPPTLRMRARVAGCMVGSLFLRSLERAERVSVAMQSRGFTGLLPPPPARPLSRRDTLLLGLLLLAQALLLKGT
jgi:cobalt/nickel transport system permease protein